MANLKFVVRTKKIWPSQELGSSAMPFFMFLRAKHQPKQKSGRAIALPAPPPTRSVHHVAS